MEALTQCGYYLGYTDVKSKDLKASEGRWKWLDYVASLGLWADDKNKIDDIVPGGPADKSGLYPDVEIIGVNGLKYSKDRLEDALRKSPEFGKIKLLTVSSDTIQEFIIDYNEGLRYHTLVPIEGKHDWLSEIIAPKITE